METSYFEKYKTSEVTNTRRVICTPSAFARQHFFYLQEAGYLKNTRPHLSRRKGLDSYLFLIVLSGEGHVSYTLSGTSGESVAQTHPAVPGDCFYLDCTREYSHISSEANPWELLWIHFNGSQAAAYYDYFAERSSWHLHPLHLSELIAAIDTILALNETRSENTEILTSQQIVNIFTILSTEQLRETDDSRLKEKLKNIVSYLDGHYTEDISLDRLSQMFFISKYYLSREFKKEYGMTVIQYILSKKITCAKELLRYSNSSIEEIATLSGIGDPSYFNKVFRKLEGCTASEYRKKW
jgi:AraC-like DNA-binding protein